MANSTAWTAEQRDAGGRGEQQHGDQHDGGQGGGDLRAARVDAPAAAGGRASAVARGVAVVDMSLLGWSAGTGPGTPGTARRRSHRRA